MDERDLEAEEPFARLRVDQIGAGVRKLGQSRTQVADLVRNVMHAGAAFGEEAADRSVLTERLEQLHAPVTDPQRGRANPLILHRRAVLHLGAEKALVGPERLVEVDNGHAEMMNPPRLHRREANGTG